MSRSEKSEGSEHSWLASVRFADWLAGRREERRGLFHENELVAIGELQPVLLVAVLDDDLAAAGKQVLARDLRRTRRLGGRLVDRPGWWFGHRSCRIMSGPGPKVLCRRHYICK